jgi:hypothetical protein
MADSIERLRAARGDQRVSFSDVADHLRDYADHHVDDLAVVQQLAAFLADVEDRPHDHDEDPDRGLG